MFQLYYRRVVLEKNKLVAWQRRALRCHRGGRIRAWVPPRHRTTTGVVGRGRERRPGRRICPPLPRWCFHGLATGWVIVRLPISNMALRAYVRHVAGVVLARGHCARADQRWHVHHRCQPARYSLSSAILVKYPIIPTHIINMKVLVLQAACPIS